MYESTIELKHQTHLEGITKNKMSGQNTTTKDDSKVLKVAFFPLFALGHLTSFLRLANKLAERGHQVPYFLPTKTQAKLASQNHFPDHLTLIPIDVPFVEGLPPGAETTNDAPGSTPLIVKAMDMTRNTIESHLIKLKPNVVFYDFSYWMPELGRKHGFKSVHYITSFITRYAYFAPYAKEDRLPTAEDLLGPPPGFPTQVIRMKPHEAEIVGGTNKRRYGVEGLTLNQRMSKSFLECDAIGAKTCKDMEEAYCEYMENMFEKPVLLAGPMVPKPPSTKLDDQFDSWLNGFSQGSVIFCALGSECSLQLNQFQELLLGLELTGRPFLAALKPPKNCETIESALPEGIEERIKGRGIIHGGWVQQQQILQHPSVGCFITHCGVGSLSEAITSKCQVVMMPQAMDQFINARMMTLVWKIGVEVEQREIDGFITKDAVNKAVSLVMEEDSEVGKEVKAHHAKWREFFLREGLEDSYITSFIQSLHQLIG